LPSKKEGGGIYQKGANIYRKVACNGKARPLLDGELHPGCFNFCGPGTHIEDPHVRNYTPFNDIDNICRTHDIAYNEAKGPNKQQLIRQADINMLRDIEPYRNEEGYRIAKAAIRSKIAAEDLFPGAAKLFPDHAGKGD
jgi:hypothetical protein